MNTKKVLIIVGIAIVALLIIAVAVRKGQSNATEVEAQPAKRVSITEYVTANGKIQPAVDVNISSEVSGEIVELAVKEGDKVQKGDLLVKINPDIYISAANRAQAALNSAKANLANAKARLAQVKAQFVIAQKTFERNQKLIESKAISQADFEQAQSDYEVAKAEVEASEQSVRASEYSVKSALATLNEAQDNLKRTTIYAPQSGTVSALNVEEGERVLGTAQMQGTTMMSISDMSQMEVHVDVNENDIIRVKMGDTALIEVDSYLGKKFKGIVTEIANAAASSGVGTDQVTNFSVEISMIPTSYNQLLDGKPQDFSPFRPGMSSAVEIITQRVENVLAVPIEAVTTRTDSTGKVALGGGSSMEDDAFECVFVVSEGKAQLVAVEPGIQDNRYIEIKSGLSEGQQVVTGPYRVVSRQLENGDAIEVASDKKDEAKADA